MKPSEAIKELVKKWENISPGYDNPNIEFQDDSTFISDLTALISEHTQQMFEFVRWIGFYSTTLYYRDFDEKWLRTRFDVDGCPTEEYDEYTTEELFEYWKTNEQ